MLKGAARARAIADAWLKEALHDRVSDPAIDDLIEATGAEDLDSWQAARVREIEYRWLRERAVPADIVAAHARSASAYEPAWRQASADDDLSAVADKLGTAVDLTRKRAAAFATVLGCGPYDPLLNEYEPGLSQSVVGPVFDDLHGALPALSDAAIGCQPEPVIPRGPFPRNGRKPSHENSWSASASIPHAAGLDTSSHSMKAGVPDDTRITTC